MKKNTAYNYTKGTISPERGTGIMGYYDGPNINKEDRKPDGKNRHFITGLVGAVSISFATSYSHGCKATGMRFNHH